MSDKLPSTNPESDLAVTDVEAPDAPIPSRRDSPTVATLGTGALFAESCASAQSLTLVPGLPNRNKPTSGDVGHVAIVGDGAWDRWTSHHLRQGTPAAPAKSGEEELL